MATIKANENTIGNELANALRNGFTQGTITLENAGPTLDHMIEITVEFTEPETEKR